MSGWSRTAEGWALNLDGSDAAARFSLPRLEIHSSTQGWRWQCLLADGTSRERPAPVISVAAAKRVAMEQAQQMLGPTDAATLLAMIAAVAP